MFKRRAKSTVFRQEDSFSESSFSSSDDEDTATNDTSYASGGSATNTMSQWTYGTDGETKTTSYWYGGGALARQASPSCFGNDLFRSSRKASKRSGTKTAAAAAADPGCNMNFIWETSSEESEQDIKMLKKPSLPGRATASNNVVSDESRQDESSALLQNAFSFLTNNQGLNNTSSSAHDPAPAAKTLPESSEASVEIDANMYNLLLNTGSSLLGLNDTDSDESSDSSRHRRLIQEAQRSAATRKEQLNIAPPRVTRKVESPPTPRTFMAPWQRSRRRQDNDRREDVERHVQPGTRAKSRRNPFSRTRHKPNSTWPSRAVRPSLAASPSRVSVGRIEAAPIKVLPRQTDSEKKLNDAIMVFDAEEAPVPITLPRTQSSKFIPSKDLMRQMERNIDRDSFISDDEPTILSTTQLKAAPAAQHRSRPKSKPRAQQRPSRENMLAPRSTSTGASMHRSPKRRESSIRSSSRSAKNSSSNRSMSSKKSKSNRSHVTSKSRQTRASYRTAARASASRASSRRTQRSSPTNQLSFSDDDDDNGLFSVGSLDA
jgi:hypothetical protein